MMRLFAVLAIMPLALAFAQRRQWLEQLVVDGDPVVRGLPRDGIPAIDAPEFVPASAATFMDDREYVIGVTSGAATKAYSTWLLNGHEIVNDRIAGTAIAVTW